MYPIRKKLLAFLLTLGATNAMSSQIGLMIGGGIDVRNTIDTFSLIPYYNSNDFANHSNLRYHVPVAFSFDQEGQSGVDTFGISFIPGLEYDIVSENKFGVSTTLGLALNYAAIEAAGINQDQFSVGVIPSLHLKYGISDKVMLRFIPASLNISPWSYTSDGVGSDTAVHIAYQIQGGLGYSF